MKNIIALLLLSILIHLTGADFSISFREASFDPRGGFVEHAFKTNQKVYVGPDSGLSAEHIKTLTSHNSNGEHILGITFTDDGARLNHAFTTKQVKQPIAIFINGKLVSAPRVMAASQEECWISGPSKDEIEQFIADFTAR